MYDNQSVKLPLIVVSGEMGLDDEELERNLYSNQ